MSNRSRGDFGVGEEKNKGCVAGAPTAGGWERGLEGPRGRADTKPARDLRVRQPPTFVRPEGGEHPWESNTSILWYRTKAELYIMNRGTGKKKEKRKGGRGGPGKQNLRRTINIPLLEGCTRSYSETEREKLRKKGN